MRSFGGTGSNVSHASAVLRVVGSRRNAGLKDQQISLLIAARPCRARRPICGQPRGREGRSAREGRGVRRGLTPLKWTPLRTLTILRSAATHKSRSPLTWSACNTRGRSPDASPPVPMPVGADKELQPCRNVVALHVGGFTLTASLPRRVAQARKLSTRFDLSRPRVPVIVRGRLDDEQFYLG